MCADRRLAANIAKLPDLPGKVRPDDNIQAVGNLSDGLCHVVGVQLR